MRVHVHVPQPQSRFTVVKRQIGTSDERERERESWTLCLVFYCQWPEMTGYNFTLDCAAAPSLKEQPVQREGAVQEKVSVEGGERRGDARGGV